MQVQIKDIYDVADKYYKNVSFHAVFRQSKRYLYIYIILIFLLLISIIILMRDPFRPITWKEFFTSCDSLFFILMLVMTFIFSLLIDKKVPQKMDEKLKLLCLTFECDPSQLRTIFLQYKEAYDLYVECNKEIFTNPFEPYLKISKFISWIGLTVFGIYIKQQMDKPDLLVRTIITVLLLYSIFTVFAYMVPKAIKSFMRFFGANLDARIELLFADLSYLAPMEIKIKKLTNQST